MDDLLATQKEILSYLRRSDWPSVEKLIDDGLPVRKVGGRWEALKTEVERWYQDRLKCDS